MFIVIIYKTELNLLIKRETFLSLKKNWGELFIYITFN